MKHTASYVVGPDGEKMTLSDLPAPNTHRWVPRRKARVVAAVEGGLLSEDEAFSWYKITSEEYDTWKSGAVAVRHARPLCDKNQPSAVSAGVN